MKMSSLLIAFLLMLGVATEASGKTVNDPDFFMVLAECKLIISAPGNIALKKDPIVISDGIPFIAACERIKSNIICEYSSKDETAYGTAKLKIIHDSAPNLWFIDSDGTEHYAIDTVRHLASSINVTYVSPEKKKTGGLVTKTCAGMYFTASEYEIMQEGMKTNKEE